MAKLSPIPPTPNYNMVKWNSQANNLVTIFLGFLLVVYIILGSGSGGKEYFNGKSSVRIPHFLLQTPRNSEAKF